VKAHFSRWGLVTDVYFPRHKKTLKRRPFCFVTFAARDAAERALAESPLHICGVPIKNLTMVEDRDQYYKEKHAAARHALMGALHRMGAAGAAAPEQVNNIAAMLALGGVTTEELLASLLQNRPLQTHQAPLAHAPLLAPPQLGGYSAGRYSTGGLPGGEQHYAGGGAHTGALPWSEPSAAAIAAARSAQFAAQMGGGPGGAFPSQAFRPSLDASQASGSMSSLSSADWFSGVSSARNSMDLPPGYFAAAAASGGLGGLAPPPPGGFMGPPSATRMSLDAALQVKQHLAAVAAAAAASAAYSSGLYSGGGGGGGGGGPLPGVVGAMQSAFYSPSAPPPAAPMPYMRVPSPAGPPPAGMPGGGLPRIQEGRPAGPAGDPSQAGLMSWPPARPPLPGAPASPAPLPLPVLSPAAYAALGALSSAPGAPLFAAHDSPAGAPARAASAPSPLLAARSLSLPDGGSSRAGSGASETLPTWEAVPAAARPPGTAEASL
jgi:hypothetical protein